MATLTTVYGVNATKRANQEPTAKIPANENYGRVRVLYDEYTVASADEFGTSGLIKCMKIPKGARLLDAAVVCPATGSTGIFDVGWAASDDGSVEADPNGIFDAADPGAAAVDARMLGTVAGWNKTFAEEVQVQIDWSEASQDGGTKTIKLMLLIAVD